MPDRLNTAETGVPRQSFTTQLPSGLTLARRTQVYWSTPTATRLAERGHVCCWGGGGYSTEVETQCPLPFLELHTEGAVLFNGVALVLSWSSFSGGVLNRQPHGLENDRRKA